MAEVAEVAEKWVLNDNFCHLCHLCQCKFLYKRHGMSGMDAESCPNDGTKMHNENFTKNDVRKVRNVRILKIITILSANFYISAKMEEDIFYLFVQNYQKWIKKLFILIYANFRV